MVDRPILFSAPMVRALLAGTKTQTRRLLALRGRRGFTVFGHSGTPGYDWHFRDAEMRWHDLRHNELLAKLPIAVGDRLWVRESWNIAFLFELAPGERIERSAEECFAANDGFACPCGDGVVFAATGPQRHPVHGKALWRPSIHMPRWASRLTLTVTDVRVQRLHDISEEDAIAEGIRYTDFGTYIPSGTMSVDGGTTFHPFKPRQHPGWHWDDVTGPEHCLGSALSAYGNLWVSINGPDSWDANPWVAAYTFTVARGNIDGSAA